MFVVGLSDEQIPVESGNVPRGGHSEILVSVDVAGWHLLAADCIWKP